VLEFLPFLELSAKISFVFICVRRELGFTVNLSTTVGFGIGFGGIAFDRPVPVELPVKFFWGGKGLVVVGFV
jgi:hypothetical protein